MRRAIHQKTISFGAKQSGKIEGGMYFVNNPFTAITDLSTGAYMAIGSGAGATQLPFILENGNDYFEIFQTTTPINPQTVAQYQKLRYSKGRNGTFLTLDWGVSIISEDTNFKLQLRVSKTNVLGIDSVIDQTVITAGSYTNANSRIIHSTIISINVYDSFFIELADEETGNNVSVTSAYLSFSE